MKPERFGVELRSAAITGNTLTGHGAVFGVVAQVPGGWEQLHRSAFDAVLDRTDTDARALINHDPSQVLGRQSAGTLRLKADEVGLRFEVDLPDTSYARDLRVLVERGDLSGASFGFVPGDDEIGRAPDGRQLRTHTSIARLLDVSAVTYPAYESASVALRHYDFDRQDNRSRLIRARARVLMPGRG
jgi:HK97 family phage prohead protease